MPQFLVDPSTLSEGDGEAVLTGPEAHHLLRVFRAKPGDRVKLFDGAGHRWAGRLVGFDGAAARIGHLERLAANESTVQLILLQAILKGERWNWLIAKSTELGATAVLPIQSRRTFPAPRTERAESRVGRWNSIALAAAKQCERGRVPSVAAPQDLPELLGALGAPIPGQLRLVFIERERGNPLPRNGGVFERIYLAIGPEGGWDPDDRKAFHRAGFEDASLGPRVLRAETAGLAALAMTQTRWGDLVTTEHP